MRREIILFLVLIFLIVNISASCDKNQIDINSASQSKLEELIGIGPVKAEAIIDSRPFDKVDDLIDVYGIGEVTLEKIKNQGLACVSDEIESNKDDEKIEEKESSGEPEKFEENVVEGSKENVEVKEEEINRDIISLGEAKSIKTEVNNENEGKSNAILYLVAFCFLLGLLFLFKGKTRRKNEFR